MSFTYDNQGSIVVYTDGSCHNNGMYGARAGIGVWWGNNHSMNVADRARGRQTSNTAEIQAATRAVLQAKQAGIHSLHIRTDSQLVVNGVNQWMSNWKQNGWRTYNGSPVENKMDWEQLDYAMQGMSRITCMHVPGHAGERGNEEAHKLANQGALMP